ncbi:MAG TPA: acetyl-CoA carboxylase, carboxyltransferase subunit beta [Deinococcales bacterium]|nr:acetyl-CoA carboxylase, carboxyltransferase subunit beta [Deinococcales bacterium]
MTLERFFRRRGPKRSQTEDLPDLWSKCPKCGAQVYNKDLEAEQRVCPSCAHHQRIPVTKRADFLADPGSFQPGSGRVRPTDALGFVDTEPYPDRLARARQKTGRENAIYWGRAAIEGRPVVLVVMDFEFSGGSLGSAEGEEIARAAELAAAEDRALILVAASGGARMQESALSLMQMAKTTVALERLAAKRLPYISILTDPTTGGVTASYATIADIIIAEPGALIGFAGPRVIQQTIKQNLPEGFQRSEFLQQHGMIDMVVDRREHRATIARLLDLLNPGRAA